MGFSFQLQSLLICGPPNWHLLICLVYLERTVQGVKSCRAFWKQKAQRCSFLFDTEQIPAGYHGRKEARSLFTLGKASWWGGHYRNWASAQLPPCVGPYFGTALTLVLYLTLNALDQWWKCWLWEESLVAASTKKECFDWCLLVMSFFMERRFNIGFGN